MIRLRVLGAIELGGGDAAATRAVLAQPRRLAVLAYLALAQPRGFQRRDKLLAAFWPEHSTAQARNALRQALHFLRQALAVPDVLLNRGSEEVGLDETRLWCDAVEFERLLDSDRSVEALELYRGDLLPGFFVSAAPDFERWLEGERTRLRDRASTTARQLADVERQRGNSAGAAAWARRAITLSPDDERGIRRLLEALGALGDTAGALRAFEEHATHLRREFEIEPSAELRRLVETIRRQDGQAARTAQEALDRAPKGGEGSEAPVKARGPAETEPPAVSAATGVHDRPTRRRGLVAAGAAIATVATLVGAAHFLTAGRLLPGLADPPDAVAVLPFSVHGRPEIGYLREGMVDVLSAKIDGAAGLRAADPRVVLATLRQADGDTALDAAGGDQIAGRLGAKLFVVGDVVEIAGRLHIGGALYERGRSIAIASGSVEGEGPRLFELVDELAAQLLAGRGRGRDTALVRLAAVTTKSLPALKAYLEGEAEFRAGRDTRAIEAFQRAVADDSTFALAYYRLATVAPWAGTPPMRADAIRAAIRHADRLPATVRQLLAGMRAYGDGDAATAESDYRGITVTHPDNVEAWFMLGETLFHYNPFRGRPASAAREAFERLLTLEPDEPHALLHLARLAAAEGRSAELDSLVRRYLDRYPKTPLAIEVRALRAFAVDDTAEQARVRAALPRTADHALFTTLTSIALHDGRVGDAAVLLPLYGSPGRDTMLYPGAHLLAAQFGLASGKWRATSVEPAALVNIAPRWPLEARALFAAAPYSRLPRATLAALQDTLAHAWHRRSPTGLFAYEGSHDAEVRSYFAGLLAARLADSAAALAHAAELDRLALRPGRGDVGRDLARSVRAQLAWAGGAPEAALAELGRVRFDAPAPLQRPIFLGMHERFLYAELLQAVGRDAEALDWYAASSNEHDLVHLAPSHLRRAQIYERMGKRAEAIFHYARFVSLWQDCDSELRPMVDDARHVLSRLRQSAAVQTATQQGPPRPPAYLP